jgi:hypothetical protein
MAYGLSAVCGTCNKQHSTETVQGVSNKFVQAVTLLTCIGEVPSLNLLRDTDYPDKFLVDIFDPSRQMPG